MKNKLGLLLKVLLDSTSSSHYLKLVKDPEEKKRAKNAIAGPIVLSFLLVFYSFLIALGLSSQGFADQIPAMAASITSVIVLFFSFLKTNAYMFAFKDYDIIMAMPFEVRTIVAAKFLLMFLKTLPLTFEITVPMLIGYAVFVKPVVWVYIVWVVLTPFLALIPMVIASAFGALIARVGSGFKHKKIVQTVLTFLFVIPCIFSRYFIDAFFKDNEMSGAMGKVGNFFGEGGNFYFPIKWFSDAVLKLDVLEILLFVGISLVLFEGFAFILARSYRKINSRLMTSAVRKKAKMGEVKSKSIVKSVAFKEFRTFIGSTNYTVNVGIGFILCVIAAVAGIFVDGETLVKTVLEGATVPLATVVPAIPFIIYFFAGMVATTCVSPSLEGKNYWIVKSMPIDPKQLIKGKMLFNLILFLPVGLFATLTLSISVGASVSMIVLNVLLEAAMLVFSTMFGAVVGIKHRKLDWKNDIEVIKQGPAVVVYLFPNMFGTMILGGLSVFLSLSMNPNLVVGAFTILLALLAWAAYARSMNLAVKRG